MHFCLLSALLILHWTENSQSSPCTEVQQQENCVNIMDYTTYVRCIRKRVRRDISGDCDESCEGEGSECGETCDECNCNYCQQNQCQSFCSSCCRATTCSTSSCCHRTCHNQCRSSRCRQKCKKDCAEQQKYSSAISLGNITTVITLKTAINNTNIIDVPVTVNNTNMNNFTLGNTFDLSGYVSQGGSSIATQTQQQKCCNVVGPQQCRPQPYWPFMQCYHSKAYRCGDYCKSPVMHMQPYMGNYFYIPQPRPRCSYQQSWPYVTCGMFQQQSCEGCYESPPPSHCSSSCYDDSYGYGSLGPFYQGGLSPFCPPFGFCGGGMYFGGQEGFGYPSSGMGFSSSGMELSSSGIGMVEPPPEEQYAVVNPAPNSSTRTERPRTKSLEPPSQTSDKKYQGYDARKNKSRHFGSSTATTHNPVRIEGMVNRTTPNILITTNQ